MAIVLHSNIRSEAVSQRERCESACDPANYREFVFRCALAICGEPEGAEDIAQDVLLLLLRAKRKLAQVDSPSAWVRKVTVRSATRYLRRKRHSDPIPEGLQAIELSPERLAVFETLRKLEPEQRALLGMALNQGLSYREIAEALDIPEGTVASRLNAAKKAFQRKWDL